MRPVFIVVLLAALLTPGIALAQQIVIDRTLQKVHSTVIMASDVRQARILRLLPEADAGDAAVLTALENRLLVLYEASRTALKEPGPEAIAARRNVWQASWPPGTDISALMTRAGMTEQALDGWFRDDQRIADQLEQRFGQRAGSERARELADWIALLRRRANLSGRRP